jgi:hypothetical protein
MAQRCLNMGTTHLSHVLLFTFRPIFWPLVVVVPRPYRCGDQASFPGQTYSFATSFVNRKTLRSFSDYVQSHTCKMSLGGSQGPGSLYAICCFVPGSKSQSNAFSLTCLLRGAIFTKLSQICDHANLLSGSQWTDVGLCRQTIDLRGRKVATRALWMWPVH